MTQLRKQKDAISNYFDGLLSGIGHRGSSFMDVDALTHDAATGRWLLQEFKHEGEALDKAQHWMLRDLSHKVPKHFTVWVVVKRDDGSIEWADCCDVQATRRIISVREYQQKFRDWWERRSSRSEGAQPAPSARVASVSGGSVATVSIPDVTEINW